MIQYEFHLLGADGSRLQQKQCSLSDVRIAWEHVFAMATACKAPGSQVQVLDENGKVVIHVGAATAAELARMRAQYLRVDPAV